MRPRTPVRHLLPAVAAAAVALTGCGGGGPSGPGGAGGGVTEVRGTGATFVQPIMKDWTEKYLTETGDRVRVNYDAKGSGAGIAAVTNKEADFGCTDAPMKRAEVEAAAAKGGAVVHVPLVIGAVVPVYTLKGVDAAKPLTFSGPVLADMFTGRIGKWNDPRIAALNPGVPLPDLAIKPVYRADKSGTSFIFASYLGKVSPAFKAAVPASTEPAWPKEVGSREQGSKGVADAVARADGAVGYVELTFALDNQIAYGAVTNRAGKPVLATLDSVAAAAAASLGDKQTAEPYSLHALAFDLLDAAGDGSYPIAAMSYAVVYQALPAATGKATVEFLRWAATSDKGQQMAAVRNFAPLPAELRTKIGAALDGIQVGR